ncbi:MAG: hypothetical protein JOZ69_02675 [Myxococcales bacterium]|nr:hypothetical protein [Myxococcales bacterium]
MRTVFSGWRSAWSTLSPALCVALWSAGCGGGTGSGTLQDSVDPTVTENAPAGSAPGAPPTGGATPTRTAGPCAAPAEGCRCDREGARASCSGPKVHTGNYTSCAPGERVCHGGAWGACAAKSVYLTGETATQDYVSPCRAGTYVAWGALTLDGVAAGSSAVRVYVQTADTAARLDAAPVVPLEAAPASGSAAWTSVEVDAALGARGESPMAWLRVSVEALPSAGGAAAPTIGDWRQAWTCGMESP